MAPRLTRTFRTVVPALFAVVVALSNAACGGSSSSPTGPTGGTSQPPATTRIIGVSGNLAFGDVAVGGSRDLTMTIANTGNAVLTVTSLSVSGGLVAHTTASWTSGTIAAGGSQSVNITFAPTAAGSYSGTVTVNGDQTAGSTTIAISGNATLSFSGTFTGSNVITACNGTGSAQDLICGATRGAYKVGTSLLFSVTLTQTGNIVTGTANVSGPTGPVTGTVNGNTLTLSGTLTDNQGFTSVITSWNTTVSGSSMTGTIGYALTFRGVPGNAGIIANLQNVTKR